MKVFPFILLIFIFLIPPVAYAQSTQQVNAISGCYSVSTGPWPDSLSHLSNPAKFPQLVNLTTEVFTITLIDKNNIRKEVQPKGLENAYKVESLAKDYYAMELYGWEIEKDSSVTISPHLAFVGFAFSLRKENEKLIGKIRSFTDYTINDNPYSGEVEVEFIPISCPD